MPTAVAAGLIYWGASTAVAAVAAAAVEGAIIGAVVGGGVKLAQGGNRKDIFKSALQGAAIGGASGGVLSIGSMAASGAGTGFGSTAAQQVGARGVDVAAAQGAGTVSEAVGGAYGGAPVGTGTVLKNAEPSLDRPWLPGDAAQTAVPKVRPALLSDTQSKIAAGVAQGAAEGGINYLGAQEAAKSQADIQKREEGYRQSKIAGNVAAPFDFNPAIWWKKHGVYTPREAMANA